MERASDLVRQGTSAPVDRRPSPLCRRVASKPVCAVWFCRHSHSPQFAGCRSGSSASAGYLPSSNNAFRFSHHASLRHSFMRRFRLVAISICCFALFNGVSCGTPRYSSTLLRDLCKHRCAYLGRHSASPSPTGRRRIDHHCHRNRRRAHRRKPRKARHQLVCEYVRVAGSIFSAVPVLPAEL